MAERSFLKLQQKVAFRVFGNPDTTASNMSSAYLTHIKDSINEALTIVLAEMQHKATRRNGSITLVSGTSTYALPARCMRVIFDTFYYSGNLDFAIPWVNEQDWTLTGGQNWTDNGPPRAITDFRYDLAGDASPAGGGTAKRYCITVRPTPGADEATNTIKFQYDEAPAEMTADADIPPLPEFLHDGLVHGAVVLGFSNQLDPMELQVESSAWMAYKRLLSKHKDFTVGKRQPIKSGHQVRFNPFRNFGTLSQ